VRITFDPAKRAKTLAERGLDFADAAEVFTGLHATREDRRRDYGEPRFISAGYLRGRFVVLVWTPRGQARRIITGPHRTLFDGSPPMRYGHADEEVSWQEEGLGRPG
jgi:uncharacterized DUF497 family protein